MDYPDDPLGLGFIVQTPFGPMDIPVTITTPRLVESINQMEQDLQVSYVKVGGIAAAAGGVAGLAGAALLSKREGPTVGLSALFGALLGGGVGLLASYAANRAVTEIADAARRAAPGLEPQLNVAS